MAYQVLYRRWRPINFDDMIGQEHITKTLRNQIINGRTSHAYIFTGIRGTGKTSTAKVFSRAINCTNPQNGNPCNECDTCKGILDGSIFDVSEIDAASNNGVDNIREIRDEVVYSATQTKYKVFIIDEVHMLSTGAFNALLKTLEEPPEHVVFILATTDIHKVPSTILSRCQRFDFRRITADDVAKHLKKVLAADGVEIDDDGVHLIARLAEGSMRDALSIADRCLAYGENTLTYDNIVNILGVAEDRQTVEILREVSRGDTAGVICALDSMVAAGKSIDIIINGLINSARNILMCKCLENPSGVIDLSTDTVAELKEVAKDFTEEKCVFCIKTLSETAASVRFSPNPRVTLEICLIKLCNPSYMQNTEALLDRISTIELKLKQGIPVSSPHEISAVEKPKEKKTVKIKPAGNYNERWQQVIELLKNEKPALFSIATQFEASGDGELLVLVYNDEECAGCEKILREREEELFNAVETVCAKRPRRFILQKKVIENATPDKLEELARLNLKLSEK
ncbi:MAG: DNA polymerase III subunit gamma/tau [Bacillota bacterium]|nr:DNA polymerase III subunit gamma/tau [Bacillota bacterium]